jgi:hypothetical protein
MTLRGGKSSLCGTACQSSEDLKASSFRGVQSMGTERLQAVAHGSTSMFRDVPDDA